MADEAEVSEAPAVETANEASEAAEVASGPSFPFDKAEEPRDPDAASGTKPLTVDNDGETDKPAEGEVNDVKAAVAKQAKALSANNRNLLIANAHKSGMSPEEIAEWGDDFTGLERATKSFSRYAATVKPAEKVSGDKPAEERSAVEDIPDLDPKEYDESIVKGWTAMKGVIARQEQLMRQMDGRYQQREAEQFHDWFDEQVAALGEDATEMFGKGRGTSLSRTSSEFGNRAKLWEGLQRLMAGRSLSEREDVFKQAYRAAFGDHIEKSERKKIAAGLTARRKSFTNPPSQRQGANSLQPFDRAVQLVDERLKAIKR